MNVDNLYVKYGHDQLIGADDLVDATLEQLNLIVDNLNRALSLEPIILEKANNNVNNDFGTVTLLKIILDIEGEVMRSNISVATKELLRR